MKISGTCAGTTLAFALWVGCAGPWHEPPPAAQSAPPRIVPRPDLSARRSTWAACDPEAASLHAAAWYESLHGRCEQEQVPTSSEVAAPTSASSDTPTAELNAAIELQLKESHCIGDAQILGLAEPGSLTMQLAVSANGQVERVDIEADSIRFRPLACCVRRALARLHLPAGRSTAPLRITYTFDFPRDRADAWKDANDGPRGGMTRQAIEAIEEVIKSHRQELRGCLYVGLPEGAPFAGGVTMRFVLARDGFVPRVAVKATDISEQAGCCIATRMMQWRFPRSDNDVHLVVTYPVVLKPTAADAGGAR